MSKITLNCGKFISLGSETTLAEAMALLGNRDTEEAHILAVMRKRNLASAALEAIARHERWNQRYAVKAAIVNHPNTPRTLALRILNLLYWKELLRVSVNYRLPMPLRTAAENLLAGRLPQLELGEKISLARSAPRRVVLLLSKEANARVMEALLTNPRLRESEVVGLAENQKTPADVLRVVAAAERWVTRHPIKLAIVKNPRTPVHSALKLLATLPRQSLVQLLESHDLPPVIFIRAERMISK